MTVIVQDGIPPEVLAEASRRTSSRAEAARMKKAEVERVAREKAAAEEQKRQARKRKMAADGGAGKKAKTAAPKRATPKRAKKQEDGEEEEEERDEEDADDGGGRGGGDDDAEGAAAPSKRKRPAAVKRKAARVDEAEEGEVELRRAKELRLMDRLDMAMKSFKWWEVAGSMSSTRWKSMEHAGVLFAPKYEPHGVKMLYDGEPVDLTPAQEELATMYAAIAPDGPHLSNPKVAPKFNRNFFRDFLEVLGSHHVVKTFEKCDFTPIREHLARQREEKKNRSKEEKEREKEANDQLLRQYGFALVDGHLEKLANFRVEPPGLFRGRGDHPRAGTLKRRVIPEDITLNVDERAVVPRCRVPGHRWGGVIHDPTVTWLASWRENVMGASKYIFLAPSSMFKGQADLAKYEKAQVLTRYIDDIRRTYEEKLDAVSAFDKQCATAMWVIDRLALRVGGEKDEDEADTVGCCSLRVEHITFTPPSSITLDFLGKDSMRYYNTIDLSRYGAIGAKVYRNLSDLAASKQKAEDLFDELTPADLNRELSSMMKGLTAKVFRTYNASVTLENELPDISQDASTREKEVAYNAANREVAILCNHQRSVPKAFDAQFAKLQEKVELLRSQLGDLAKWRRQVGGGQSIDLLGEGEEKTPANSHYFKVMPSLESVEKRLQTFGQRLANQELQLRNKDENKLVALSTSKINYIDPRVIVAFCKRTECPIEVVYPRTLRDKFPWAMGVPGDWGFVKNAPPKPTSEADE